MKKSLLTLLLALGAATTTAFGQAAKAPDPKVEAQIIALEKAGWEAWRTKNVAWVQANVAPDIMIVNADGVKTKDYFMKEAVTECEIKSCSLADFKLVMLDENVALMTYTATQDGTCAGKAIPPKVRATVNYVKRGGKWLEAFYMEKPAE